MTPNPFISGNPVDSANFFNRKQPLRRVVGRLLSGGQSTAVIGEPRLGKTSLLKYLAAREKGAELYGEQAERLLIAYLDSQVFGGRYTAAQFWEQAFTSADLELALGSSPNPLLAERYRLCRENEFGPFTLEALFRVLKIQGWRLVLLLDEFDTLLHHPILNSAEFFGSLRSLSSRCEGALALVIGSRLPLAQLNARTQAFNPTGSPYFNIFSEITLGPFPEKDIHELLNRAGERFTVWDKRAIRAIAGGHPFLLQAAAAAMWDLHEEEITEMIDRRRAMAKRLYNENRWLFADTWRFWTPPVRKAVTTIALAHTGQLLPQREFLTSAFIAGLRDFGPELADLATQGFISRDERVRGGWRIASQAMLWWLADELARAVRPDIPFEEWLRAQELDHLLTKKEREQLQQVVRGAAQLLGQGATSLIEAFAKGLGESLAGGE
jgi:hypothetical protein